VVLCDFLENHRVKITNKINWAAPNFHSGVDFLPPATISWIEHTSTSTSTSTSTGAPLHQVIDRQTFVWRWERKDETCKKGSCFESVYLNDEKYETNLLLSGVQHIQ
jgi:hypothetical protein